MTVAKMSKVKMEFMTMFGIKLECILNDLRWRRFAFSECF